MNIEAELMSTVEAAEKRDVSARCIQILCDKGKVAGAVEWAEHE